MTTRQAPPKVSRRRRLEDWNVGEGRSQRSRGAAPPMRGAATKGPTIDPRMRQRGVEVQEARGRRRMKVTAILAATATVLVGAFGLLHTGLFGLRHVRVSGSHPGTEAALLRAAGLVHGEPLVDIHPSDANARLDRLAWVTTASVTRAWPDSVDVTVSVRRPVAQVPVGASPTGPVETLDATGRILGRSTGPVRGLPVVVGVSRPGRPGAWLPGSAGYGVRPGSAAARPPAVAQSLATATGGVQGALAVAAGIDAYGHGRAFGPAGAHVARVEVAADGTLTALVTPGSVTVTFGAPDQLAAKVTALVSMLDAVRIPAGATLDLRVPDRPTVTPAKIQP